jgi:hypothetical protein
MTEYRRPPKIVVVSTNFYSRRMSTIAVGLRTPTDVAWITRVVADLFGAPISDNLRDMEATLARASAYAPIYQVQLREDSSLQTSKFWSFPPPSPDKVVVVTNYVPIVYNFKTQKKLWKDNYSLAPNLKKMLKGNDWPSEETR